MCIQYHRCTGIDFHIYHQKNKYVLCLSLIEAENEKIFKKSHLSHPSILLKRPYLE